MRRIASFILILSIYACNENAKINNNSADQTAAIIKSITDDLNIVGHWSMCAESGGGGQMIQYNVCPTVIFNNDGSGSKISAGGFPESFSWTLNDKSLKIFYSMINGNKTFPDTNYIAIFRTDTSVIELEIRQPKKDYSSYLSRQR